MRRVTLCWFFGGFVVVVAFAALATLLR